MVFRHVPPLAPQALLPTSNDQPPSGFCRDLSRAPPTAVVCTIVGASTIRAVTVTVDDADAVLPLASVTRKTTVVLPIGNRVFTPTAAPLTSICRVGAASARSVAVPPTRNAASCCEPTEPLTFPRAPPISVPGTEIAAGAVTIGGVVSCTVTRKEEVRLLPLRS